MTSHSEIKRINGRLPRPKRRPGAARSARALTAARRFPRPSRLPPRSPGCAAPAGTRASALLAAATPAAAPLAVRTHNMTKKEKSFNQSLAEWKLFIYSTTTREFLGPTAKSWGLSLLFCLVLLWVPGCTLFIHKVGYASGSER